MAKHKVEIQDHLGNIYYPHTTTDVVFDGSGKRLSSLLDNKETKQTAPVLHRIVGKGCWNAAESFYFKSNNKFVEIYYNFKQTNDNYQIDIATLPVGFRPPEKIIVDTVVYTGNAFYPAHVWVDTSGNIVLSWNRSTTNRVQLVSGIIIYMAN